MASHIITSIHSTLDDLQLLQDFYPGLDAKIFKILMHKLRSLRTFLLCSTKLGQDVHLRTADNNDNTDRSTLGCLLVRIEDVVCRSEIDIRSSCVCLEDEIPFDLQNRVASFLVDIQSFEGEIDGWYISLSAYPLQLQQSCSPMTNQVKDVADSVLENLEDFLIFHRDYIGFLVEPVEALIENITFLRNFTCFAALRIVDQHQESQDLLAHIETVAVSAAHLTVHLFSASHYNVEVFSVGRARSTGNISYDGMKSMISAILQKIKPVDPHVYETYIRALESLKYSTELQVPSINLNDDPITIDKK